MRAKERHGRELGTENGRTVYDEKAEPGRDRRGSDFRGLREEEM